VKVFVLKAFCDRRKISHIEGIFTSIDKARAKREEQLIVRPGHHYQIEDWIVQ
jgi:hypothetical protein